VGSLYVIHMLSLRGLLPEVVFPLALDTVLCGVAAASVVTWFRGRKGRRKDSFLEVGLLAVVGIIWLAVGIAILFP
jgi:hypothetical protein